MGNLYGERDTEAFIRTRIDNMFIVDRLPRLNRTMNVAESSIDRPAMGQFMVATSTKYYYFYTITLVAYDYHKHYCRNSCGRGSARLQQRTTALPP